MKKVALLLLLVLLVLPLALGLTLQEDDLVFDDEESTIAPVAIHRHDERKSEHHEHHSPVKEKRKPFEMLWGLPNAIIAVGHVYKLRIPRNAFSGSVDRYEAHGTGSGHLLPRWLYYDEPAATLLGVPSKKDIGSHHISVKAFGKEGDVAKDTFTIQVIAEKNEEVKHKDGKTHCDIGEEQTLLTIVLDARFENLSPLTKVDAIENLAGFLGLHTSAFSMHPYGVKDMTNPDTSIILTGPGNVKHRKEKHWTSIQWQVGCNGNLWHHQSELVKQLREQAKDGTLTEVLQLPVLLWRVKTDENSFLRNRREVGSGDFMDEYEAYDEDYDDDDYEDNPEEGDEDEAITKPPVQPSFIPDGNEARENSALEHPHRHHHGEETIDWRMEEIDEKDIVPVDQNVLGSSLNATTVAAPVSTTQLTTPSTTTTTTTETTTTTTTTTTTSTTSTSASITTTVPSSSTTTTATTSTTVAVSPVTNNTYTATTADTTAGVSTVVPTSEQSRSETTMDQTEKTKIPDFPSETILPNVPSEFTTHSPSESVTRVPSTSGIVAVTTEAAEIESTTASINVTADEPTEQPAIAWNDTTTGTTQHHFRVSTPPTTTSTTSFYITTNGTTTAYTNFNSPTYLPTTTPPYPVVAQTTTPYYTYTSGVKSTVPPYIITTLPPLPPSYTTTPAPPTTTTTTTAATTPSTHTTTATTSNTTPPPTVATRTTTTTTESTEFAIRNNPPRQDKSLKKLQVTAGKSLSYVIPQDTFSDSEDGDTRRLKLSLLWQGAPIKPNHWLQFNSHTQEVYGLPLETDVSTWIYELVAADSEGSNVTSRLDIHVHQHKLSRSVNHDFSIHLKIDKWSAFTTDVDWELKVVRSLAELYDDYDSSHITVRSIDIDRDNRTNIQAVFTWFNDSLPRSNECPTQHINKLLRVLITDSNGDPSASLVRVLGPEIRVKRVVYKGIGQCESALRPAGPEVPQVPTYEPKQNFPPVPRNQVDHVNATVGQLLVYKVPEDTFFDAEDGSSRNMRMSLLTIDRVPIPAHEWLQFDSKNQEFYGIPLRSDIGRKEYQLIVTDKDGASATDGLVVIVHPALPMQHTVEFSMTLDIPYESFANSAFQKRNFIEKLSLLYGDRDSSAISLESISEGSTVITWNNRTLPTSYCAHEEINRLRSVLVKSDNDQRSVTDRVGEVMGPGFPVKMITVIPMGICLGELTGVHSPDNYVPPVDDSTSVGTFHDDYLLTFVLPAIIIAAMLILAGIIACVLYRRRRIGKMSVSEQDDERQSFRSKGIPVIFQDELDEKPDPGNKSPVILKEEKPPLPPPEYQKAEDGADVPMLPKENSEEPYQPPPPFATNRDTSRQNRPKPTPTYRKPPPYVPP